MGVTSSRGILGLRGPLVAAAALLLAPGPVGAQTLSVPSLANNSSPNELDASSQTSFDRQSSLGTVTSAAASFQIRYASTASTDAGAFGGARTETQNSDYTISFTITAPGAYYFDVSTQIQGQLDVVYDGGLVGGDADISAVTGTQTGGTAILSGSLGLGDPGSCHIGGGLTTSCHLPFNQVGSARIFGVSNGAAVSHTLRFTWVSSASTNAASGHEGAARLGIQSRDGTNGASQYPGDGSRNVNADGHFVTVTLTSLCGNGVADAPAGSGYAEDCDNAAGNGTAASCCNANCTLKPGGTLCRATAGACDVAETCPGVGTSGACPADGFLASGSVCRAAAGECDLAETCSGTGTSCPADAKKANGTACADDANPCTTDTCNGASTVCQHPAGNAGATCRVSGGACDPAETCTGASASCPADARSASGTVCRAAAGACDVAEACDGTSAACPADAFVASGSVCRAVAGVCDVAETCTGTSSACPADARHPAGTACPGDGNGCTDDVCDGSGTACTHPANSAPCSDGVFCNGADTCGGSTCSLHAGDPCAGGSECADVCNEGAGSCFDPAGSGCTSDGNPCTVDACDGGGACGHAPGNAGAVCRVAAGVCDVAEVCDGTSAGCPADSVAGGLVVCRPAAGGCDVAEHCDGASVACPADAVVTAGTDCRAAAGVCDIAEACDGTSPACPADAVVVAGTVCRAAADACDAAETCDGTGGGCAPDALVPAGTVCGAAGDCNAAATCDGLGLACPPNPLLPDGTACSGDGNVCTADACLTGVCTHTTDLGGCLDEFNCYKGKTSPGTVAFPPRLNVQLVDQFESGPFDVKSVKHLCPPADVGATGIVDVATHLEAYKIKLSPGGLAHTPRTNLGVVNLLGTIRLDTIRADLLLVPTATNALVTPAAPDPLGHNVDHFKCYKVRVTRGALRFPRGQTLAVGDEFTSPAKVLQVIAPKYLCTPVDEAGVGIKRADRLVTCYKVRPVVGQPLHVAHRVFANNQYGPARLDTVREDEFCLPSALLP